MHLLVEADATPSASAHQYFNKINELAAGMPCAH
jgi:hypothetical protein